MVVNKQQRKRNTTKSENTAVTLNHPKLTYLEYVSPTGHAIKVYRYTPVKENFQKYFQKVKYTGSLRFGYKLSKHHIILCLTVTFNCLIIISQS